MVKKGKSKRSIDEELEEIQNLDNPDVISNFGEDENFDDDDKFNVLKADEKALEAAFGKDLIFDITLMRLTPEKDKDGRLIVAPVDIRFKQLSMSQVIGLQRGERSESSGRVNPKVWERRAYQILKSGVLSHEIVDTPRFGADYAAGEISFRDFNPYETSLLWEMIAPGSQKSHADLAKRALSILRVAGADLSPSPDGGGTEIQNL